MSKEYVSLYHIIRELAEEEKAEADGILLVVGGEIKDSVKFATYYKKRKGYIKEIFKKANLLENFIVARRNKKNSNEDITNYSIPISQKESIKQLLRLYTDPVSRKIRKNKIETIKTEEIKNLLEKINVYINKNVTESRKEKERENGYVITQFQSRAAFDEVEIGLLKIIGDDLSNVKAHPIPEHEVTKDTKIGKNGEILDKEGRIWNDSDAAYLMYYYYYLLSEQSKIWNQIVDTVAELRFEECSEMIGYSEERERVGSREYQFRDIRDVLREAKMLIFERNIEKITEEDKKSSEEQLCVVENLLKNLKK